MEEGSEVWFARHDEADRGKHYIKALGEGRGAASMVFGVRIGRRKAGGRHDNRI